MKKITFFMLFCGLLAAQANFVYQSGSSFMTTADLDGDGNPDMVLVDGSNATVRVGYQLAAKTLTWSAARSLGLNSVTDIACGNVLNGGQDVLVATEPMLNRLNLYNLSSASAPPVPMAAYVVGEGPESVMTIDISGSGNTPNADLFSFSTMNGVLPYKATRSRSDGTAITPIASNTIVSHWTHMNAVEYVPGGAAIAVISPSATGSLRLYFANTGSLGQIASKNINMTNAPNFVSLIPAGASYAHFILWEPGQSVLKTLELSRPFGTRFVLSSPISVDIGEPIKSVQVVYAKGIALLAVTIRGGQSALIFEYDSSEKLSLVQEIEVPHGELVAGFLPLGTDDLVMLSSASGDFSGAVSANQMEFSKNKFVVTGMQLLAAMRGTGKANVMTFASEPFVNKTPRRLQLLRAGDWSARSRVSLGTVSAKVETDSGIIYGLGNPQLVSLGTAHPSANYTLDNQLHAAISTYSFNAARGDELVGIVVTPDPGMYGTSITVSFSTMPSAAVYYRTSPTGNWTFYLTPFTLFKDATIQYYAVGSAGQTIIREASYTFSDAPSDLDSDGDGVPDYVEIANGLDPLTSGLDSDGDGFSDLEELLAGTNPLNASDMPASRLEQGTLYDLALSPFTYDGVANKIRRCAPHTQVRLFSASGGLRGYAKAHVMSINGQGTIAARFNGVSRSAEPPFLTVVTDPRYDLYGVSGGNQRGVEMVGVYTQPESTSVQVPYIYQGGALGTEANSWIASAQAAYSNQVREVVGDTLKMDDVLSGLLIERKLADLLYSRGVVTNTTISLFKGRVADQTLPGFRAAELQGLESTGAGGEPAYHLPTLISTLQARVPVMPNMQALVQNVYDTCSDDGRLPKNAGKYPLPVDVIRTFIDTGVLHSNYLAKATQSSAQRLDAYTEVMKALAAVPKRTKGTFMLSVQSDSFDAACPVLYTGGNVAKSLYSANGNPFRFPITFTLQPGAQVNVEAYTDVTWNQCPGTDPLEVISLSLTAVPTASGSDANGNLIPDDYEALFLAGSGGDLDGDGYSDLQEYLDRTDPADATSFGTGSAVSLTAPVIQINDVGLSINWPAAYVDAFEFAVEYVDALGDTFTEEQILPRGALDATIDQTPNKRFYRVKIRLR